MKINGYILCILLASQIYFKATAANIITDLQTDRYCYVSGDYIFLKVVCKPFGTDKTLKESIIYVDIANADSSFVTSEIFKLKSGTASGYIEIPDTLETGNYIIRTYTYSSRNNNQNKVLDSKHIFVTNRFNQAYEKLIGYSSNGELKLDSDNVLVEPILNDSLRINRPNSHSESDVVDSLYVQKGSDLYDTVMYINIFDIDSQFVASEVFKFNKGLASGFINLTDTLKPGLFLVRAYSNELKHRLDQKGLFRAAAGTEQQYSEKLDSTDGVTKINLNIHDVLKGNYLLSLNNDEYKRRSKVTGSIKLSKESIGDTAWLTLTVKPISACESLLSMLDNQSSENKMLNKGSDEMINSVYEDKGMIISGYLSELVTHKPLTNALVLIAREDSSVVRLNYSITDNKGKFSFLKSEDYNDNSVYISTYTYPQMLSYPNAKVIFDSKFINKTQVYINAERKTETSASIDTLNVLKSIVNIAYDINSIKELEIGEKFKTNNWQQEIIGEATESIELDDYVEFTDFVQIVKEILNTVRIQKEDNKYQISVVDRDQYIIYKNPMVFVDGVPILDIKPILNLGSDKIKSIQVQSKHRYFGNVPFENGMIFIWTRNMDYWSTSGYAGNRVVNLPDLQKPVKLIFPDYSKLNNKRYPDFRQVLFWEPSIVMMNNKTFDFSFYTSDEVGEFEMLLKGINNKNQPVEIRKYFKVKND